MPICEETGGTSLQVLPARRCFCCMSLSVKIDPYSSNGSIFFAQLASKGCFDKNFIVSIFMKRPRGVSRGGGGKVAYFFVARYTISTAMSAGLTPEMRPA